jgi:hypothetical protein
MENPVFTGIIIPQVVMSLYGFTISILLLILSLYHILLIATNETTSEQIKGKYSKWGGNPYNFGSWSLSNFKYFIKQQESLIYTKFQL